MQDKILTRFTTTTTSLKMSTGLHVNCFQVFNVRFNTSNKLMGTYINALNFSKTFITNVYSIVIEWLLC